MNIEKNEFIEKLLKFEKSQLSINMRDQDLRDDTQFGWHTSKYKINKNLLKKGKLTLISSEYCYMILKLNIDNILKVNVHSEFDIIVYTVIYLDKILEFKINGEKVRKDIENYIKMKRAAATTRFN